MVQGGRCAITRIAHDGKETGMDYERDYLTGLWTRQAMYSYYRSLESGSRVHFMFLDVDNFKTGN
ncbi:MAG: hypothetical protein K2O34_00215, partial [Acetatifactor sp.]|nr:hypothetical protein [Acetatifactor sp.]